MIQKMRFTRGGTRRFQLLAVLAALATAAIAAASAVQAQTVGGDRPVQAMQSTKQSFRIAPGPLDAALRRFARQSGLQLIFDPTITRGFQSIGFHGRYVPGEALGMLLMCTGIDFRFTSAETVVLERFVEVEPIVFATESGLSR